MGRYYSITLSPPSSTSNPSPSATQTYTSYPNGAFDPGALNVQLDLPIGAMDVPLGGCTISIDGVALSDLLQAQQYAGTGQGDGYQITVKGGMGAQGLPLANPAQAGLLLTGVVYQAFGNWVGTDMNINFVVVPSTYTFAAPGQFVLNWPAGTPLASAISNMLLVAYPNNPPAIIQIGNYVNNFPVMHQVTTLGLMAQFLKPYTASATSSGVQFATQNNAAVLVFDGSTQGTPVQLVFTDLIGQPKWVDQNTMQFMTVMRADIQVGSYVLMPQGLQNAPGIVQTAAASLPSSLKYKTSFQGQFLIQQVRHLGNFRDPDGASWTTVFQAVAVSV